MPLERVVLCWSLGSRTNLSAPISDLNNVFVNECNQILATMFQSEVLVIEAKAREGSIIICLILKRHWCLQTFSHTVEFYLENRVVGEKPILV